MTFLNNLVSGNNFGFTKKLQKQYKNSHILFTQHPQMFPIAQKNDQKPGSLPENHAIK